MKRSSHVALLLMGATGVGAGAYAMTPSRDCVPRVSPPAAIAPGQAAKPECSSSSRSSGTGYSSWSRTNSGSHWSRPIFSRSSSGTNTASTSAAFTSRSATSAGVTRSSPSTSSGGFGSTGHSYSSSSSS